MPSNREVRLLVARVIYLPAHCPLCGQALSAQSFYDVEHVAVCSPCWNSHADECSKEVTRLTRVRDWKAAPDCWTTVAGTHYFTPFPASVTAEDANSVGLPVLLGDDEASRREVLAPR